MLCTAFVSVSNVVLILILTRRAGLGLWQKVWLWCQSNRLQSKAAQLSTFSSRNRSRIEARAKITTELAKEAEERKALCATRKKRKTLKRMSWRPPASPPAHTSCTVLATGDPSPTNVLGLTAVCSQSPKRLKALRLPCGKETWRTLQEHRVKTPFLPFCAWTRWGSRRRGQGPKRCCARSTT